MTLCKLQAKREETTMSTETTTRTDIEGIGADTVARWLPYVTVRVLDCGDVFYVDRAFEFSLSTKHDPLQALSIQIQVFRQVTGQMSLGLVIVRQLIR